MSSTIKPDSRPLAVAVDEEKADFLEGAGTSGGWRRRFCLVVITARYDCEIFLVDGIDEAMGIIDPTRPKAGEILAQRFGFSNADEEGAPKRIPD